MRVNSDQQNLSLLVAIAALIMLPGAAAQQSDLRQDGGQIGGRPIPPSVLQRVEPEYSEEARASHIEGTVVVRMIVDKDGTPRDVAVSKSVGYGLDAKAIEAVTKWKFIPGRRNGKPFPVLVTVDVTFRFADTSSRPEEPQLPTGHSPSVTQRDTGESTTSEKACEAEPPGAASGNVLRHSESGFQVGVLVEQIPRLYAEKINPISFGDPPLRQGDLIVSWTREAAGGEVTSPFDWYDVVTEQLPRGPVVLHGIRVVECPQLLRRDPPVLPVRRKVTLEQQWVLSASLFPLTTWRSFPLGARPSSTAWEYTFKG